MVAPLMFVRLSYLAVALIIFAVEVLIATCLAHTGFIRGSLGDVLVVMLLYCLALSFRELPRAQLAIGVFLFGCAVEATQAIPLAEALGFARGSVLRIVLGDTFRWDDLLAYGVGCGVIWGIDTRVLAFRNARQRDPLT